MDNYHDKNVQIEQGVMYFNTRNIEGNEGNVGPPQKRVCTMEPSSIPPPLDDSQGVNTSDMPLPIPTTHVDRMNVRQQGSVHHDYGTGHSQVNITHCGTMRNQGFNLGMPQLFVQPQFEETAINYRKFDRQVVSYG